MIFFMTTNLLTQAHISASFDAASGYWLDQPLSLGKDLLDRVCLWARISRDSEMLSNAG
jgi:hypothetical protein